MKNEVTIHFALVICHSLKTKTSVSLQLSWTLQSSRHSQFRQGVDSFVASSRGILLVLLSEPAVSTEWSLAQYTWDIVARLLSVNVLCCQIWIECHDRSCGHIWFARVFFSRIWVPIRYTPYTCDWNQSCISQNMTIYLPSTSYLYMMLPFIITKDCLLAWAMRDFNLWLGMAVYMLCIHAIPLLWFWKEMDYWCYLKGLSDYS